MPREIYNPSTGVILGGALSGPGVPTVQEVAAPLIPTVTELARSAGVPGLAVIPSLVERLFPAPAAPAVPEPSLISDLALGGAAMSIVPVGIGLGGRALALPVGRALLPTIERVVAKGALAIGGASLAKRIYDLYISFRRAGHHHKRARKMAHEAQGFVLRRRRMRPTNVRALRRAIRRVHGFQRIAHKVGALGTSRRGRLIRRRRGPHRRRRFFGDVDPFVVEETLDIADEFEDLTGDEDTDFEAVGE